MRFMTWLLLLATWLFVSAFVFGQSVASAVLTVLAAVVLMGLALASPGKPALRYGVTLIALALPVGALFLPDVSNAARLNAALLGAVLFALSVVKPVHHGGPRPVHPHGPLEEEALARPT